MRLVGIMNLVAIMMVSHICADISVVVSDMYRSMSCIIYRIVSPEVRRAPWCIIVSTEVCHNHRTCIVYRFYNVVRTIDIRRSDNLYMIVCVRMGLGNDGCNILINIHGKDSLDHENVGIALDRLDHTKIIHVSILIEVKVGNHV